MVSSVADLDTLDYHASTEGRSFEAIFLEDSIDLIVNVDEEGHNADWYVESERDFEDAEFFPAGDIRADYDDSKYSDTLIITRQQGHDPERIVELLEATHGDHPEIGELKDDLSEYIERVGGYLTI